MDVAPNALAAISFLPSYLLVEAMRLEMSHKMVRDEPAGNLGNRTTPVPAPTGADAARLDFPGSRIRGGFLRSPRGRWQGQLRSTDGARRGPSVAGPSVVHDGSFLLHENVYISVRSMSSPELPAASGGAAGQDLETIIRGRTPHGPGGAAGPPATGHPEPDLSPPDPGPPGRAALGWRAMGPRRAAVRRGPTMASAVYRYRPLILPHEDLAAGTGGS
jgi:hypothetical protein